MGDKNPKSKDKNKAQDNKQKADDKSKADAKKPQSGANAAGKKK